MTQQDEIVPFYLSPLSVVFFLRKRFFKSSCGFYCHRAKLGSNSYYIYHKGYPRIRISDHRVHPDSYKDHFIYIDILKNEGVFINNKLLYFNSLKKKHYQQAILERFRLEVFLYLAFNHKQFLYFWHTKKKKPLYFVPKRNCKGKDWLFLQKIS